MKKQSYSSIKKAYQKIDKAAIRQLDFEGYYWYSNEKKPHIQKSGNIDLNIFTELPFVIEASFYAKREQISIQVKNIDGQYHFAQIDLKNLNPQHLRHQNYIAHDLGSIGKFQVVESWQEQADELLEGMTTLVPAWAAFAGFVTKSM